MHPAAFFIWAIIFSHLRHRSSLGVLVQIPLGLAEVFLDLAFRLFHTAFHVLAVVVGKVTEITANLALHFLCGTLDLILESALFQILRHNTSTQTSVSLSAARCGTLGNAMHVPNLVGLGLNAGHVP